MCDTREQRLAGDAVIGRVDGEVAMVVEPAVGIRMLVEPGSGPFEALAPVGVCVDGVSVRMGWVSEELVGVDKEVWIRVQGRDESEEEEGSDSNSANEGAVEQGRRCG